MADEVQTGQAFLEDLWWTTMDELYDIVSMSENVSHRIEAADTILRYFVSMNTGIHEPFVPKQRPHVEDDDDDD